MTQPTQAQIEAAALIFNETRRAGKDHITCWHAALTAAAAAGAGGFAIQQPTWDELLKSPLTPHGKAIIAATIERCAQVVKELADQCNSTLGCAFYARAKLLDAEASIRALKERP